MVIGSAGEQDGGESAELKRQSDSLDRILVSTS